MSYTDKYANVYLADCSAGTKYELNGEAHTVAEWAYITGIKRSTIQERIKNDWPIETALVKETRGQEISLTANYHGQIRTHKLQKWSALTGIPMHILKSRFYKCWEPDRVVNTPYTPYKKKYAGFGTEKTIAEWLQESGISQQVLSYRLSHGDSIEQATKKVRRAKKYEVDGKMYTIKELMDITEIKRSTLRSRLMNGVNTFDKLSSHTRIDSKKQPFERKQIILWGNLRI